MTDPIFQPQSCEPFKGFVHLAIFGLATAAGLYNLGAALSRRELRLAANTVIYGALIVHEARETMRHFGGVMP